MPSTSRVVIMLHLVFAVNFVLDGSAYFQVVPPKAS